MQGPHRVQQYGGVPPYYETRTYVARIVRDYNRKKIAERKTAAATAKAARTKPATPKAPAGVKQGALPNSCASGFAMSVGTAGKSILLQRLWRVDPRVYLVYLGSSVVLGGSGPPLTWIENAF